MGARPGCALLALVVVIGVVWAGVRSASAPRIAREGRPAAGGGGAGSGRGQRLDGGEAASPSTVEAPYECLVPDVVIEASEECAEGLAYPDCRHRLPDPEAASGLYDVWRNTAADHLWGRPALVRFVLATAREYARVHPGERITVGDLDAPGPRHKTHNRGVDVDLYLPGAMATENRGRRDYVSNYDGRPDEEVREKRARVLELAQMAAHCAGGKIRIYYNDPPVLDAFLAWFERSGLSSPFRRPMEPHNLLHLFHFHVTVPRRLAPLPAVPGGPEEQGSEPDSSPGDAGPEDGSSYDAGLEPG